MSIQKTVTILGQQCPNNVFRSSLSRKLYNWFQLVSFTIFSHLLSEDWLGREVKLKKEGEKENGEIGKLMKTRTESYAPHKHL